MMVECNGIEPLSHNYKFWALTIRRTLHMAGQLGLEPKSMVLETTILAAELPTYNWRPV